MLGQAVRTVYSNLRAAFANYFVRREVVKVLRVTHAAELMVAPMNEWPLIKRHQSDEIRAVATGAMNNIIDRRSWSYPYLPEALHRLNQPILKNTPYNLRRFSETPIPRRAINLIKNSILSLKWHITEAEEVDEETPELELRKRILTESFKRPNNTDSFRNMLESLLEDLIIGGYGCIEPRVTPNFKRPFKMWTVDGSTVRIFMDWTESTPDRPKYAQMTGLKGERGIVTFLEDELIYIRDNVRTSTPFGLGKLEVAFNTVNAFLAVQQMSTAAGADQVHKTFLWWEQSVNQAHIQTVRRYLTNEQEGQAKISMVAGMKPPQVIDVQAVTPEDLLLDWQEFLIRIIGQAFDISPMSLGLERDVNRNTGQIMADADFRGAVIPMAKRVEEAFCHFIHTYLKWRDLMFAFIGLEDLDSMTKMQLTRMEYMMNATFPDEIREGLGKPPIPGGFGRLTNMQMMALVQYNIAKLTGKAGGAGGGGGMGGGMGSGGGMGGGMGMRFGAQDVATMTPDEIQMYQELGLLPPTQQLGDQMEQEAPGILETLSDELRQFFEEQEQLEDETQVQPAMVTPAMERAQQKRFAEEDHVETLAEKTINRRGVFGPAVDSLARKNAVRGKYPRSGADYTPTRQDLDPHEQEKKLGKDIARRGRQHNRPGRLNPYQ